MDESTKTVSFSPVQVHSTTVGTEEHSKEKQGSMRVLSRLDSPIKSNCEVFMFGFGTGKFPAKMELSDIKRRQLRHQTIDTASGGGEDVSGGGEDEIDRRRSGKKRWWLLIDVFGCGGGYEEEAAVKDLQASFPTLKRFD
ncbi:hypothetical protein R6Q59_036432 [Mikania micrantha]|uniref:Uncharacterized protein n=1 Tax=Mikania micrantha TaxID=192012 RepID=A0A5N6P8G9_9ASTR|nr:hypothetical protein E3N88_13429 [Mikania micrantha]